MSPLEARCLDSFPAWLRTLADDARALAALLETSDSEAASRAICSALGYLFKSLDLIQDGLEDLGYIDDAFVLRVAALGVPEAERTREAHGILQKLAAEAELVREFLGDDWARLEAYVTALANGSLRDRSVAETVASADARSTLAREARAFAEGYVAPSFSRDAKTLLKLRAFLKTKLA